MTSLNFVEWTQYSIWL